MSNKFTIKAPFAPAGDQPKAIQGLTKGIISGLPRQTLLGVTGSGKTFTAASVIKETQKPALVISHNKTLAAQLTSEFHDFFPENKVEYFVSYYDYYQPEAYIPRTDTYIAKDASINDEIDRLRHSAMEAILTRDDVVVVASVSCIYGLGSPEDYQELSLIVSAGQAITRQEVLKKLTNLQYSRNDTDLTRGSFRVRGDTVDIHPAGEDYVIRIDFFGPKVDLITQMDALTGKTLSKLPSTTIFPATFFITTNDKKDKAIESITSELNEHVANLEKANKLVEAQRIAQRTKYDLEMIKELGYVSGIENYSRHLDGRTPGEPPSTLIDYFIHRFGKDGFITIIDESHMTIPQISAMYGGDSARKKSLIEHGFRLPSAKDNRPLQFHEFEDKLGPTIFISATPADYEKNTSKAIVEQIVRPTGLLDPTIEIKPTENQIDDVVHQIQKQIKKKNRILVTTLTKRMAEELSTYLIEMGIKSAYIHSDVDTLQRLEILRDLRLGVYDVLIGINLLREGLDLPEVTLVAIMDADKEGYLRSQTALIQTMGRAARHQKGHVIMYADRVTVSMQRAIDETNRRRAIQEQYNKDNNITPKTISKEIKTTRLAGMKQEHEVVEELDLSQTSPLETNRILKELTNKMQLATQNLEFEKAGQLRDQIKQVRKFQQKNV